MDINTQELRASAVLVSDNPGIFDDIIGRTYDFMNKICEMLPEEDTNPELFSASCLIFNRIIQDLRCVDLCASRGYPAPAGTIAASIWELSFEIKYLHLNPDKAEKWFEHRDVKHTETRHDNRINKVLSDRFQDAQERAEASEIAWSNYAYLCAFKHGNSMFQQLLGSREDGDITVVSPLPDLSEFSVTSLIRIIYHACEYSILSAQYMANQYLSEESKEGLEPVLKNIVDDLHARVDAASPR